MQALQDSGVCGSCLQYSESYVGGSVATARVSLAGQVKGDDPD
jgi:hypothetical protein